jgi:hypothetical protein
MITYAPSSQIATESEFGAFTEREEREMNEKQKALYEYLETAGDNWTPQVQVARDLYEYFGNSECCLEPKDYHNTTERLKLLYDCREINSNPIFEKIIISNSKGIKLATEEEFYKYINNQYSSIFRKLKRVREIECKAKRNNQINFMGDYVEAFLKDISENFEIDIDN